MRQSLFAAPLAAAVIVLGGEAAAQTKAWTLDADFDAGTLSSVAHVPSNQLVLGKTAVSSTTLVWATNYLYGYVVRIDSSTGKQTGRFDVSGHIGYFKGDGLVATDWFAKSFAYFRISDG